jgi:translation initiation factor IF-3
MFRGREQAHPERGRALLERLYEDVAELGTIESQPLQEGRNMHMMLGPSPAALRQRDGGAPPAEAQVDAPPAQAGGEAAAAG